MEDALPPNSPPPHPWNNGHNKNAKTLKNNKPPIGWYWSRLNPNHAHCMTACMVEDMIRHHTTWEGMISNGTSSRYRRGWRRGSRWQDWRQNLTAPNFGWTQPWQSSSGTSERVHTRREGRRQNMVTNSTQTLKGDWMRHIQQRPRVVICICLSRTEHLSKSQGHIEVWCGLWGA